MLKLIILVKGVVAQKLKYVTKECQKPYCMRNVYAHCTRIDDARAQITYTQKHSRARVIIAYQ